MPVYVALLRAINLGARRRFPKDEVRAAVEAAGGTDVASYLNTGNVRLRSPRRSTSAVEADLEAAFLADRGFAVPTVVLTTDEVRAVAAAAAASAAPSAPGSRHYVELLRDDPDPDLRADLEALSVPGRRVVVSTRAVHVLTDPDHGLGTASLFPAALTRRLGVSTNRTAGVVAHLAAAWCA